jgi:hypothetical protein
VTGHDRIHRSGLREPTRMLQLNNHYLKNSTNRLFCTFPVVVVGNAASSTKRKLRGSL